MAHLVTGVVSANCLEHVKDAVRSMGVHGLTVSDVQHSAELFRRTGVYRGSEYTVDAVPRVRVEILCDTFDAERIAATIAEVVRSEAIGAGFVWIAPVDRVLGIRTDIMGIDAV